MKVACTKCDSSDGVEVYDDHDYCFVCSTVNPNKKEKEEVDDTINSTIKTIPSYRSYPITSRGISHEVVEHFSVRMETDAEGKPCSHYYPYTRRGKVVAYKERRLPKDFRIHGDFKNTELFGQSVSAGDRTLVITEGEIDCLSVAEAYKRTGKRIYPVVSLPSASAKSAMLVNREYINGFSKVILMLDQDEAGEKAVKELAKIIKAGNCYIAKLPEKDPNDTLMKHGPQAIIQAIWRAVEWSPAGILTGEEIWDEFQKRQQTESIPYPPCLDGLNRKLEGIRHGEITLFTSGTGSGKSTVIKEIILNLKQRTEDRVGLISLEESIGETTEKFISMELQRPISDPPPISEEEMRRGFEQVFGDKRLVLLDHQGSVGDSSLIDKIEHMALMGCKYLVLDHITIAVSEGSEGLSGNEAIDKMMSDLLKVVKRHNIWLGLISHLRKAQGGKSFEDGNMASIDDIKGSGSIKQISFDIIAFARDLTAQDEELKNTVAFRVLKSRFTGRTGDAGSARYDPKTTRLSGEINLQGM